MSRFIEISRRAWTDLRRILRWLDSRSPKGALAWYQAFWKAATRVADGAESYPLADESPRLQSPVREALFKTRRSRRYRIIFDFSATELFILCIRRPGQRPLRRRDLPSN